MVDGWTAEAVSRAKGYDAGMVTMFGIGCGAAALMIIAQRSLWRSARLAT